MSERSDDAMATVREQLPVLVELVDNFRRADAAYYAEANDPDLRDVSDRVMWGRDETGVAVADQVDGLIEALCTALGVTGPTEPMAGQEED